MKTNINPSLYSQEKTRTASLYLEFCLTSIRCIQATVEFLPAREQTRLHDRPYTNGYFLDLVDQIKQYAQQIQYAKETGEKVARGEKFPEKDAESYVPFILPLCTLLNLLVLTARTDPL
jgi:hypothetical protein